MQTATRIPRTFLDGLVLVLLIGAQQACQPDAEDGAEDQTEVAGEMMGERAEDAGVAEVHWGYEGDTGPDRWGGLDPSLAVCDTGVEQSPVDLTGATPADADAGGLDIEWQATETEVVDNGHTIRVNMAEGSSIVLEGRQFSLVQFHFHLPSEHTVDGAASAMEVHFVHAAEEGDLAVIGVFMEAGDADATIQSLWEAIPSPDESPAAVGVLDPGTLLPGGRGYFRYQGSLTTPPCSEVVSWVVMTESISVSQAQVDAFAALYPMNARPVQPLNGRDIALHP
ncbi:carbonic anhydrase [Candidatus Palauibacter sp.]|uniref:carbonic anhydrase n=1 Tax=Candidatus Palauibacter sp. TaxID=3101350 RepID=UPI003B027AC8